MDLESEEIAKKVTVWFVYHFFVSNPTRCFVGKEKKRDLSQNDPWKERKPPRRYTFQNGKHFYLIGRQKGIRYDHTKNGTKIDPINNL